MTTKQNNLLARMRDICSRAICHYGQEAQRLIAIEEMSELTKALCKVSRDQSSRDKIADEVADVYICLSQIELMFKLGSTVPERMAFKLGRLEQRMDAEYDADDAYYWADLVMKRGYLTAEKEDGTE